MSGFELADGTTVTVAPPSLPAVTTAPPAAPSVVVLPVTGPAGPQGTPGDANDLTVVETMIEGAVQVHVVTPEPHPAYDDLPSLRLLFENGLV